MKRLFLILALFYLCCLNAIAQVSNPGLRNVNSLPSLCTPSGANVVFLRTGSIGPYYCQPANTWNSLTGGSVNVGFGTITTGTNTAATMTVGSGANLTFTGTGIINASKILGTTLTGLTGVIKMTAGIPSVATAGTDYAFSNNNLSFFSATTSAQLLALLTDPTGTGSVVFSNTPTLVTPTIASFVNATHNHQAAAGGGTLAEAALALTNVTTNDATTTAHGFAPKGTAGTTQFWRQDWTLAVPPGGCAAAAGTVNTVLVDNGSGCPSDSGVTIDPTAGLSGGISLPQGNPKTPPANNITIEAPTVVTAYRHDLPGVAATGLPHYSNTANVITETISTVVNADIANSTIDLTTKVTGTLPVPNGGTGAASFTAHGPLVGETTGPIVATSAGTSGQCYLSNGASADPSFQACPGGAGAGNSVTSTTPVTVNTNTTSDQQLMELSLGAGYFNSSKQPFLFDGAGVYTTQTAQTPTLNLKIKLCTISGCGSGTVVTLITITSTATIAAVTNNNWNLAVLGYTATTGATGNLEIHGPLAVDLGALTTTADSIFVDTNTAVSSNIDLTAALFVDFTIAFSTNAATANTFTQRSGGVMPFAATAAPVTSVFGQTGAVGNLSGDCTTSGSTAITCTKLNGTAFAGTNGDLVSFGAANIPADSGILATNAVRKDAANTGAAAMTLDMSASTVANAHKVPVVAGATATVNGAIDYDSTNNMLHAAQSSADAFVPQFTAAPAANNNCAKWVVSGSNYKLGDAGAACGTGGSTTNIDYTKHWELDSVNRNGGGNLGMNGQTVFGVGTLWGPFSGTPTFNNRAADANFQFYTQMAPASGGNMAGSSGAFGAKEWFRISNTFMHVRAEPVTATLARYTFGFSDCAIATIVAADNPTCNNAYLLASTTTANPNWYCVVGNGTTSTATDTTIAWAAATAYELEVDTSGSNIICKVNGTGTTVTTNLPATNSGMYGGYITVSATSGAATTTLRWDRLYLQSDI